MRIAILGSRGYPFVYSGYETFVAELSRRLVERGHEVIVYCRRSLFKRRPSMVDGIQLTYLPSLETKTAGTLTHGLLSTLHVLRRRVDILLYLNSANGPFGLLTRLFRRSTVINVDGLEWLRPKWTGLGGKYFRFASWLATRFFDEVVTDADEMARVYRQEFGAPSTTIAYGANVGHSGDPGLLRQFGLQKQDYYLIVGRLIPDNNAELVVEGFKKAGTRRKLVVVGDVPYQDEYARRVKSHSDERILFLGYIRDQALLRELYCHCYAYIHGHEFGGTNPSLLTSLGYGCCVLALDTPFSREVLSEDRHGLYFRKDPSSFEATLSRIDADPDRAEVLRARSRSRIEERYTWDRIVSQYLALFETLANRSAGVGAPSAEPGRTSIPRAER